VALGTHVRHEDLSAVLTIILGDVSLARRRLSTCKLMHEGTVCSKHTIKHCGVAGDVARDQGSCLWEVSCGTFGAWEASRLVRTVGS